MTHIWVINLMKQSLSVYADRALREVDSYRLPEFNLTVSQSEIFPPTAG